MIRKMTLAVTLLCTVAMPVGAMAQLKVVATTTSMAMLAREVGGERVSVTALAPPDRDAHYLAAKPGMIRDLRRADLVVAVGADLEVGWLPAAIRNAANPAIQPGKPGYFEATAHVPLRDAGQAADRSQGDVHPAGNPHVQLDPIRMGRIAGVLADRLGQIDGGGQAAFRENAEAFAAHLARRVEEWQRMTRNAPGALLYHKDMDYLMERLGVPILGYVEPLPGVPPTARHISSLVDRLQDRGNGVILHRSFDSVDAVRRLGDTLGWPATALPVDPPLGADRAAYVALLERYVDALQPQ